MLVEVRFKETLETAVYIPFGFAFDLLRVNIETLSLDATGNIVTEHPLGLITNEFLVTECLLIVSFLHEFKPCSVESVDLNTVYISPCMTQTDLFLYDDIFAKADTFIVHVTFFAFIVAEKEHLCPSSHTVTLFRGVPNLGRRLSNRSFVRAFSNDAIVVLFLRVKRFVSDMSVRHSPSGVRMKATVVHSHTARWPWLVLQGSSSASGLSAPWQNAH